MANRIRILPETLANKIAAGEVVERPASVVKELVENALDAGASRVFVDIQSGGSRLIRVSDDGSGMGGDDALLAFERHATSKLLSDADLFEIRTLGFRGEALPSISSVSRMRLVSSTGEGAGTAVFIEGGKLVYAREEGAPKGTTVEVKDLFFNTPARFKFMKSRETEFSHIAGVVEKAALAHPNVYFRLTHDAREALLCPSASDPRDRVAQVYGTEFASGLSQVTHSRGGYKVEGFVSSPGVSYPDKSRQEFFVNSRPVKSPVLTRALYDAAQSAVMKHRHPACVVFISMPHSEVDVNVHPAKREVRFHDGSAVHRALFDAVTAALGDKAPDSPFAQAFTETPAPPGVGGEHIGRVREAAREYMEGAGSRDRFFVPAAYHKAPPTQGAMVLPAALPATLPAGKAPGYPAAPVDTRSAPERPRHNIAYGNPAQIANSYIAISEGDGLLLIDQHAAHERIQYEKVKARHGSVGGGSQGLLVPESLELSSREAAVMEGIAGELCSLGIEVEHFGGGSWLIRSKPLFLEKSDVREVVRGIIADIEEKDVAGGVEALRERIYQLIACKSAVKAGQRLHPEAMTRLVHQLFECEMPYTCAHGRPTVVRVGVGELERMFKRK